MLLCNVDYLCDLPKTPLETGDKMFKEDMVNVAALY
jgi:hypothetical protein